MNLLASVIVPFVLQALWLVAYRTFELRPPEVIETYAFLAAALVGFVFLAREFRLYSLLMALVYFPAMAYALIWFSFVFVGGVYHDWP
jgi:hypothetical protein